MRLTQIEICEGLLPDRPISSALLFVFQGTSEVVHTRFQIYKNSSLGSLQKVLGAIYPACKSLVGEEFFGYLSKKYIIQYPLCDPLVTYYGEHFSNFIRIFPSADSVVYLAEMAAYEWKWHCVFHGPDHPEVDLQQLAQAIAQYGDQILLSLPAGSEFMTSSFPLHQIWQACQPEYEGDYALDFSGGPEHFIFWQQGHQVKVAVLTATEYTLLTLLKTPRALVSLCEAMVEPVDEILPKLYRDGCIISLV